MKGKKVNLLGNRYGKLTVTAFVRFDPRRGSIWLCQCDCGNTKEYLNSILHVGDAKSCGCSREKLRLHLTGQTFGDWTVISLDSEKRATFYWYCQCKCGTKRIVRGTALVRGKSLGCGCTSAEKSRHFNSLPPGIAAWNTLFKRYQREAKNRNILFCLTKDEFKEITTKNCFYCDSPPSNLMKARGGSVQYNGIDRKNNLLGYEINNVVPCCGKCNRLKYKDTEEDFLTHIFRVANFQLKKRKVMLEL
jgi:hypothetical protein